MSSVFVGGGGTAEQSLQFDNIYKEKVLDIEARPSCLYIPLALEKPRHNSAFEWFCETYSFFECPTLLRTVDDVIGDYTSIYLGGGYTHRLLYALGSLGLDGDYFSDAVTNGTIIYGGSAGGVLMGKSLLTAREVMRDPERYMHMSKIGFNLCQGMSIRPHFGNSSEERSAIDTLAKTEGISIIALGEESGVIFCNSGSYEVFNENEVYEVHP